MKEKMKQVYNCYKEFIEKEGYSPSHEEVSKITGLSLAYISMIVSDLVELGYLKRPRDRVIIIGKEWK